MDLIPFLGETYVRLGASHCRKTPDEESFASYLMDQFSGGDTNHVPQLVGATQASEPSSVGRRGARGTKENKEAFPSAEEKKTLARKYRW